MHFVMALMVLTVEALLSGHPLNGKKLSITISAHLQVKIVLVSGH